MPEAEPAAALGSAGGGVSLDPPPQAAMAVATASGAKSTTDFQVDMTRNLRARLVMGTDKNFKQNPRRRLRSRTCGRARSPGSERRFGAVPNCLTILNHEDFRAAMLGYHVRTSRRACPTIRSRRIFDRKERCGARSPSTLASSPGGAATRDRRLRRLKRALVARMVVLACAPRTEPPKRG